MHKILVVGGGYAGFYTAWKLEKKLRRDEAELTDLASPIPGARTVPNAQHAVRQGKRAAANIAATLHGHSTKNYVHHSLGIVATLGIGHGVFQFGRIVIKGLPAWIMHRGYHVLAVPSWERKIRVLVMRLAAGVLGRDVVSLLSVQHPRDAFVAAGTPPSAATTGTQSTAIGRLMPLHPRGADSLHQRRKVNADRGDYSSPSRADVAHRHCR